MPRGLESGGLRGPFDDIDSGGFPDHVESGHKDLKPHKKKRGGSKPAEALEGGVEMIGKKRGASRSSESGDDLDKKGGKSASGRKSRNKRKPGEEEPVINIENANVEETGPDAKAEDEARTNRILRQAYLMLERLRSYVKDGGKSDSQKKTEVKRVRSEIERTTFSKLDAEIDSELKNSLLANLEQDITAELEKQIPRSNTDSSDEKVPRKSKKNYVWSKGDRDTRDAPSKTDRKNLYKYTGPTEKTPVDRYDSTVDSTVDVPEQVEQQEPDVVISNESVSEIQHRPDNFTRAMKDIDSLRSLVSNKGNATEIEQEFRRIFKKIGDTQFSNKGGADNENLLRESLIEELKDVYASIDWSFYKKPEDKRVASNSNNRRKEGAFKTDREKMYEANVQGVDSDFFRDYSLNDSEVLLDRSMTKKKIKGVKKAEVDTKESYLQTAHVDNIDNPENATDATSAPKDADKVEAFVTKNIEEGAKLISADQVPDNKTPEIKKKSKIFKGDLIVGMDLVNPEPYPGFDKVLEDDTFITFANEYGRANGFDINELIRGGDEDSIEQIFIKYGKVRVVEKEITEAYRELVSEKLDFGAVERANTNKETANKDKKTSEKSTLNAEAVENIRLYLEGLALNGGSDRIEEMFQTILDFKTAPGKIKKAENELMEELSKWKDQPGLQDNETIKESLRSKIAERGVQLNMADKLDKSVEKKRKVSEKPIYKVASVFPDLHSIRPETVKLINRLAENEERSAYNIDRTNGITQATTGALALWAGMSLKEVDACIDELVELGLLEEGKSKDPSRDDVEYVRIISKPSEILQNIIEVSKGEWVSKDSAWTGDEAKYAQKVYKEQADEIKHEPYKWHQRVRQVGELLKNGHLSKTEADRGLGLFGRMFGTTGKIKRAAEKIRLEHKAKKEEYENALKKIEEMEAFERNAKVRYQQLRKKLVSDSTITHLVRYSLTKEIIGQINQNIENTEKAGIDGAAVGYLEKGQRKIKTVKKHLESTDSEYDHLVDKGLIEKVQKEIDTAFKDVLAKKVRDAIEKISAQKEGTASAHKNFHDLIMRVTNNPLRGDISYGTMEKKEARDFVAKILREKDDELAQREKVPSEEKKDELAMKRRSINLIIRDLKLANQNEK